MIDFGRTQEPRIGLDILVPVEPCVFERHLDQVTHRVTDPGRDHIVDRRFLL